LAIRYWLLNRDIVVDRMAFTQKLTLVIAAMVMLIAADFYLRPKSS